MKAIVTVIGKDKPGIIAKVSTCLAQNLVNIEDITTISIALPIRMNTPPL